MVRNRVRWDEQIGNRELKQELARRGLSLAALARLAGVGYYRVARPALGYGRAADDVRRKTAEALNMRPEDLWGPE